MNESYLRYISSKLRGAWFNPKNFSKLLKLLLEEEFIFLLDRDKNRYDEGLYFRKKYCLRKKKEFFDSPCSILEVMVTLAEHEHDIMENPDPEKDKGIGYWFSRMLESMGVIGLDDNHFDEDLAKACVQNVNWRLYSENGKGGLFTVENPLYDMRDAELWFQMMWDLNE